MKALISLMLFSLVVPALAGTVADQKAVMDALYGGDLAKAGVLIDAGITADPEKPEYYFLKAHYAFYFRYFSQEPVSRDSIIGIIITSANRAVELGKQQKPDIETRFIIGSSYGLLSRAHIMNQELWDGYWAARNCRSYLEEVVAEDPTYYDAYVGLGVLEYYPDRLAGIQAGLAWLGGMSGDGDKGLVYFGKAAEHGSLLKDEATYILGSLYRSFEIDYLEASRYFSILHQRHPGNPAIESQYRQTNLASVIERNGIYWLRENLDTIPDEYEIRNSGVLNGMAYSFMGQQETDIALALFHANIDLFPNEANPFDSIAECYATLGNTEDAIRYSTLCLEKLDSDTTINDQFRETLKELNEERLKQMEIGRGV